MILPHDTTMQPSTMDTPPPYQPTETGTSDHDEEISKPRHAPSDQKTPPFPDIEPMLVNISSNSASGPSRTTQPAFIPTPQIYRYVNPDGSMTDSLLPPSHPEIICLQNGHELQTNYGLLGILVAVFWFPLGVGLCLLDRRVKCARCGHVLNDGVCG
ncbi:hypothetical protein HGRIS_002798 [Hohenbuehelia grisea]|uniref:Brain protein I3 n=1 Tax=Hohenbuehelia grisea TaxID=104357 RepID=A0ABR3JLQ4_9AGAR